MKGNKKEKDERVAPRKWQRSMRRRKKDKTKKCEKCGVWTSERGK
jgi:hypothetical protein